MCLWSHPWPRAPKTLINSQVIRTLRGPLFLKRWLWVGSWITPRQEQRIFGSTPTMPSSRERRGAGNGVNNLPCLQEEASIKSPKYWTGGASRWVNLSVYGECDMPWFYGDRRTDAQDSPRPCPVHLFIWLSSLSFITSFNKWKN